MDCLNKYFTSITNIDDSNTQLPLFEAKTLNNLTDISCTANEVETLINLLNPNKATGPDDIRNSMLKLVSKEVSTPLSILFNKSFNEGNFAMKWKESMFFSYTRRVTNLNHQTIDPFHYSAILPNFRNALSSRISIIICTTITSFTSTSQVFYLAIQLPINLSTYTTTSAKLSTLTNFPV